MNSSFKNLLRNNNDLNDKDYNFVVISKDEDVEDAEINNVIQIIDESGDEVNCTYDKFLEIFDTEGLAGFIY
jgi:hypothetical protein